MALGGRGMKGGKGVDEGQGHASDTKGVRDLTVLLSVELAGSSASARKMLMQ